MQYFEVCQLFSIVCTENDYIILCRSKNGRLYAIYDIPLKGSCIVSIVDIYFQWVTKRYILLG